jgi:DNA-binding protein HU-beta
MNKSELINAIAASADISKAAAGRALDATTDAITNALKKGDAVTLIGFGTFKVSQRAARTGRNPRTGAELKIAARKAPAFSAGKALKDAVNK